jgi:hypothetical protein
MYIHPRTGQFSETDLPNYANKSLQLRFLFFNLTSSRRQRAYVGMCIDSITVLKLHEILATCLYKFFASLITVLRRPPGELAKTLVMKSHGQA